DCTTVTADLDRSIPAFRTPSAATRRLPRFAEKGASRRFGVACWAYCLTPDPRPSDPDAGRLDSRSRWPGGAGSTRALSMRGRARRGICFRGGSVRSHVDEDHLMAAARTVALDPARARRVGRA